MTNYKKNPTKGAKMESYQSLRPKSADKVNIRLL